MAWPVFLSPSHQQRMFGIGVPTATPASPQLRSAKKIRGFTHFLISSFSPSVSVGVSSSISPLSRLSLWVFPCQSHPLSLSLWVFPCQSHPLSFLSVGVSLSVSPHSLSSPWHHIFSLSPLPSVLVCECFLVNLIHLPSVSAGVSVSISPLSILSLWLLPCQYPSLSPLVSAGVSSSISLPLTLVSVGVSCVPVLPPYITLHPTELFVLLRTRSTCTGTRTRRGTGRGGGRKKKNEKSWFSVKAF